MMKLTVAFLAALAAADAAEARTHRQARRQYGYGGDGYGGGHYGGASSAAPVETPKVSSVVSPPYIQSSAEAFKTSLPVDAASSYAPTPSPEVPTTPEVPEGGKSSSPVAAPSSSPVEKPYETPVVPASSSVATPVASSSAPPAHGGDYGAGYPVPSSSGKVPSNSGVFPSSSAVPSGAYPSGGVATPEASKAASSSKVPSNSGIYPSSGVLPSGTGYAAYPTGTGSSPASSTPLTDMVTKTIYSTQIYHISSSLTTKVVPVGTTVCAADEASKTPSVSSAPAVSSGPVKVVTSEYPVSEITKKVTETLVYTVGVGSTAHPVTTEVVSTSTSTIYKTVVVTVGKPTPTGGYPVGEQGTPDEQTSTKTIKSTTTSTKYITVKPTPSGGYPVGEQGTPVGGSGKPTGPAGGADCAAPVTVTVTAKETVYVTKGAEKPTPGAEKPAPSYPSQPEQPNKPSGGADKPVKPSATPSAKYPIGNGTHPYPSGPTGFQTSTKPAYPVGTGSGNYGTDVPSKPTSSLPAFSFVSEVPYITPSGVKTPSVEKSTPVATPSAAYPPAGGEYGSGYGEVPAPSSSVKPAETPAVPSSKVPSNEKSTPVATPTPAGNGYGSGYGTY